MTKFSSLAAAGLLAVGACALTPTAGAEELQDLPETRLPQPSSQGSSLREPSSCAKLNTHLSELKESWDALVEEQDFFAANQVRVDFTNVAASYYQCMYAANILRIDPLGSSSNHYQ